MYDDGNRQTISELQRAASAMRNQLLEETAQLERVKRSTVKAKCLIDQLLHVFAREVEESDREAFLDVLQSTSEDLDVSRVPLLPIAIALANSHFSSTKRLHAAHSRFVDDGSVIFLAHVLRFSPSASQVELLDVSGTKVTEKGLSFILEMMEERETPFTLIAKD